MSAGSRGSLIVVSGPSGVGKTSLVHRLLEEIANLRLSVSYTTRPPRPGERDAIDYFFTAPQEFERLIAEQRLVEYAQVFGNYYGTSRDWIDRTLDGGDSVLLEIDWQGARQIRRAYDQAVSIMIFPPSIEGLEQRLRRRDQDDEQVIRKRMREAGREMSHFAEYDYLVFNREFDVALDQLLSIVRAAGLRTSNCAGVARGLLANLQLGPGTP